MTNPQKPNQRGKKNTKKTPNKKTQTKPKKPKQTPKESFWDSWKFTLL